MPEGAGAGRPRLLIEEWLPAAAIGVECMRERGSGEQPPDKRSSRLVGAPPAGGEPRRRPCERPAGGFPARDLRAADGVRAFQP
jgi:hypothetical protein